MKAGLQSVGFRTCDAAFGPPAVGTDTFRPVPAVRWLAAAAGAGIGLCAVLMALLHVLPAERKLNPISHPISSYALTHDGWLFDLGVVALALGLAALLSALALSGRVATSSLAFMTMTACCVALIAVVIFPDRTSQGALTTSGRLHWTAAMLAFGGLPVAPVLLGRRHHTGGGCSRLPGLAGRLSFTAGGWFAVLVVGSILEVSTILPLPLWHMGGLVERVLAATEMVVAAVLVMWAWHGCPCGRSTASDVRALAQSPGATRSAAGARAAAGEKSAA